MLIPLWQGKDEVSPLLRFTQSNMKCAPKFSTVEFLVKKSITENKCHVTFTFQDTLHRLMAETIK